MSDSEGILGPPSRIKPLLEFRALPEYLWGLATTPLLGRFPLGDRHPVIVIPGFMGTEKSTLQLRRALVILGYQTFEWRLGRNTSPVGQVENDLLERVQQVCE